MPCGVKPQKERSPAGDRVFMYARFIACSVRSYRSAAHAGNRKAAFGDKGTDRDRTGKTGTRAGTAVDIAVAPAFALGVGVEADTGSPRTRAVPVRERSFRLGLLPL